MKRPDDRPPRDGGPSTGSTPESGAAPGCARVRAQLLDRMVGALDPLEAARDEGHLEACPACAQAAGAAPAPPAYTARLYAVGDEEWRAARDDLGARLAGLAPPRPARDRELLWRGAFALAASILALVLMQRVLGGPGDSIGRPFRAAADVRASGLALPERAPAAWRGLLPGSGNGPGLGNGEVH